MPVRHVGTRVALGRPSGEFNDGREQRWGHAAGEVPGHCSHSGHARGRDESPLVRVEFCRRGDVLTPWLWQRTLSRFRGEIGYHSRADTFACMHALIAFQVRSLAEAERGQGFTKLVCFTKDKYT